MASSLYIIVAVVGGAVLILLGINIYLSFQARKSKPDDGNLVFTAHYLLKRGHCCQSGCLNCPYNYSDRIDPNVPAEFNDAWESFPESDEDDDDDND